MKVMLAALAALTLAPAALATPTAVPDCGNSPALAFTLSTSQPFQRYLEGIGAYGWVGKQLMPSTLDGCGPVTATELRFFVLLRSFPAKPTAAQWQARYRPLILAAITADTTYLGQLSAYAAGWAATYNQTRHCGVAPNPPGVCDLGVEGHDHPEVAADAPMIQGMPGIAAMTATKAADVAWLRTQLRVARPSV